MKLFLIAPIFLGVLFLPLLFIDGILIYFMNGSYENIFYIFLFLFLFYVLDFLIGIFIEALTHTFLKIKAKYGDFISFLFEIIGSYCLIFLLDFLFRSVQLPVALKITLVAVHGLIFFFIDNFSDEKKDEGNKGIIDVTIQIPIEMQNEIRILLKETDPISCIGILQERYPEIPFQNIVKAVRKINNEIRE